MPKLANRVQETTTTGGTGTVTLGGAVTGYQTFASSFTTSSVLFYTIDNGVGEWEIGIGTLLTTGTLSRDTVIASSNGGSLVNFSLGTKRVFSSAPTRALVPDQDSKSGFILTTDGTTPIWTQTLNGVTIGNTSAGTGAFTTLSASSTVSGAGFSNYLASPPAIGGTSPAAGAFTTLSSSSTTTLNGTSIPASKTLVTTADTQTLTGKTISGANNTLSAIGNASLTNSSITINGTPVSLGGSISVAAMTYPGAGIAVSTGSAWGTSKTSPSGDIVGTSDSQTLTGKTISGANNTLSAIGNASLTNSTITFGATSQALGSTVSALNAVTIGQSTAAAGAFTTLSASSTVSGTGFSTYLASPPAIGGTAAAAGTFTNLAYTGTLTGGTGVIAIGTSQIYKDASGNVGIGTATPTPRLHIKAGSSTFVNMALESTNGGTNAKIYEWINNGGTLSLRLINDAYSAASTAYEIQRSATDVSLQVWLTGNGVQRLYLDSSQYLFRQTSNAANTSVSFNTAIQNALTLDSNGNFIFYVPTTAPSLTVNNTMVFNRTSNTNLRISVRGSDGTTRVANITLA